MLQERRHNTIKANPFQNSSQIIAGTSSVQSKSITKSRQNQCKIKAILFKNQGCPLQESWLKSTTKSKRSSSKIKATPSKNHQSQSDPLQKSRQSSSKIKKIKVVPFKIHLQTLT